MSGAQVVIPYAFAGLTGDSVGHIDADFTLLAAFLNNPNNFENYLADTGAVNACVVTFPTGVVPTLVSGLTVSFLPAVTNTGATTLTVGALATKNLVNQDGSALVAGQLVSGNTIARAIYNATLGAFVLQAGRVSWALITGTPTTVAGYGITNVPDTIAAVGVAAIGSTIMGWSNTIVSPGSNEAGSNISYCDARGSTYTQGSPGAGTWKCRGASTNNAASATNWTRIT